MRGIYSSAFLISNGSNLRCWAEKAIKNMEWLRKSKSAMLRKTIAEADYKNNRDLSWARTDPDPVVRRWAAFADYEAKRDLTWARMDVGPDVRYWADRAYYDTITSHPKPDQIYWYIPSYTNLK